MQFGHARFAYNWALAQRESHYSEHGKGLSYYDTTERLKYLKNIQNVSG